MGSVRPQEAKEEMSKWPGLAGLVLRRAGRCVTSRSGHPLRLSRVSLGLKTQADPRQAWCFLPRGKEAEWVLVQWPPSPK